MSEEDGLLSFDDAYSIGVKIAEMADRVKVGHRHTPGAQCKWAFEMDGTRYDVVVSVASNDDAQHRSAGE